MGLFNRNMKAVKTEITTPKPKPKKVRKVIEEPEEIEVDDYETEEELEVEEESDEDHTNTLDDDLVKLINKHIGEKDYNEIIQSLEMIKVEIISLKIKQEIINDK